MRKKIIDYELNRAKGINYKSSVHWQVNVWVGTSVITLGTSGMWGVSKAIWRIRTSINKNNIQSELLIDSCGNKKFPRFSENSELTNPRCKEDH